MLIQAVVSYLLLINTTNRLIALMLGRLRMDIDTCIENYIQLSSKAFRRKRSRANLVGRAADWWKLRGVYGGEGLATEFKAAAKDALGDEEMPLKDPDNACRV